MNTKSKIIIVEDNEFSRYLLLTKLKKAGYENIDYPESSVEAWEMIAFSCIGNVPYDLVITDLNMPDLDGMDLVSKIKEDPMSKDLKVMVVSADADKLIIDICLSLGALAYIPKPIVESEFLGVVEAILEQKQIPEIKGMFSNFKAS